jgi:pimeloyl-ACP methyl ester carboxylesterase
MPRLSSTARTAALAAAVARCVLAQDPLPPQLSNMSQCLALGFPSLDGYLSRLALSSPYGTASATGVFAPLYSTLPLDAAAASYGNISTAVIYVHGLSGNANSYFCSGAVASAEHAGVLTLAPWFGSTQVTGAGWGGASDDDSVSAFWTTSRWLSGGNNSPKPAQFTTAFDVLDALIANLSASAAFPNLRLITLVGFSAGSQLASRYAFASAVAAPGGSPHVRVIVSNPSSFLYIDKTRPAPSCRPLRDTGGSWACADFETPPEAAACDTYDDYKYGTRTMGYLNLYLAPFDGDPALLATAVTRFAGKDVVYIMGTGDVCNCNADGFANTLGEACFPENGELSCTPDASGGAGCCDTYPDAQSNALDTGCEAMVQGSNRLQRGLLYFEYLTQVYADKKVELVQQLFTGPFAHNNSGLYASEPFQRWCFEL